MENTDRYRWGPCLRTIAVADMHLRLIRCLLLLLASQAADAVEAVQAYKAVGRTVGKADHDMQAIWQEGRERYR